MMQKLFGNCDDSEKNLLSSEEKETANIDVDALLPQQEKKQNDALVSLTELNNKFITSNAYLIIGSVFIYFLVGITVYHKWINWSYLDCLYYLVVTTLTIGYGDYVPQTGSERVFTAFFVLIGIGLVGVLCGAVSSFIFDSHEKMQKINNHKAFLKMREKKKQEEESMKNSECGLNSESSTRGSKVYDETMGYIVADNDYDIETLTNENETKVSDNSNNSNNNSNSAHLEIAETASLQIPPDIDLRKSLSKNKKTHRFSIKSLYDFSLKRSEPKEKTFDDLRDESITSYDNDIKALRMNCVRHIITIFITLLVGMVSMHYIEGWNTDDSFYWSTVTLLTIGYGDFTPKTSCGKWFTIIYAIFGCTIIATALTDFVKYPLTARRLTNEVEVINQFSGKVSSNKMEMIFNSDFYKLLPDLKTSPNEMTKCEFVLLVLVLMNKVEEKDVFLVSKLFENWDTNNNKKLDREEMDNQISLARSREEHDRISTENDQNSYHKKNSFSTIITHIFNHGNNNNNNTPGSNSSLGSYSPLSNKE